MYIKSPDKDLPGLDEPPMRLAREKKGKDRRFGDITVSSQRYQIQMIGSPSSAIIAEVLLLSNSG